MAAVQTLPPPSFERNSSAPPPTMIRALPTPPSSSSSASSSSLQRQNSPAPPPLQHQQGQRGPLPSQPAPPQPTRRSTTGDLHSLSTTSSAHQQPYAFEPPILPFSSSSSQNGRSRSASPSPSPTTPTTPTAASIAALSGGSTTNSRQPQPQPGYPFGSPGFIPTQQGPLGHYPFIPSPHPNGPQGAHHPHHHAAAAAQAAQAYAMQQAHFQQQQWQLEMAMRQHHQQQQFVNSQGLANQSSRRRATSGPAPPHHSLPPQQFYPPPSFPQQSHHSHSFSNSSSNSSLGSGSGGGPPGGQIMLQHGYLTPPGSDQGREREREQREKDAGGGYHPYRRDNSPASSNRPQPSQFPPLTTSTSLPQPKPATPSPTNSVRSGLPSHPSQPQLFPAGGRPRTPGAEKTPPLPSVTNGSTNANGFRPLPTPTSTSSSNTEVLRSRTESLQSRPASSTSFATLPSNPPRTRTESSSSSSNSHSHSNSYSNSTPVPNYQQPPYSSYPHLRSDSQTSFNSTLSSSSNSHSHERHRTHSNSSSESRSATPVGVSTNGKRPSPLGRRGTVEDEDSDDTAEAEFAGPTSGNGKGKEKEKEKKSKWKKAFGLGSGSGSGDGQAAKLTKPPPPTLSSSTSTSSRLGDLRIDGSGATSLPYRPSHDSDEISLQQPPRPSTPGSINPSSASISGKRSLFNSKVNSSTDNISISSTVSSASVMIRKLGQMGKMARRNSLMSLTKAFKGSSSKDKNEGKDDDGKSGVAEAMVSHATAEVESGMDSRSGTPVGRASGSGISPAAALAKKQKELFKAQEREREERSKTTDDVVEGGLAKSKMLEKEKERLKSRKGRKWGFGSSSISSTTSFAPPPPSSSASSIAGDEFGAGGRKFEDEEDETETADGDATPRGSLEILSSGAGRGYETYGPGAGVGAGNYFEDQPFESPAPIDEGEFDGYVGAAPRFRREEKKVRGILKGAGSYNQEDYASRGVLRNRANSFDSPAQQGRPGSPGNAALVGKIPSEAQVDGLVHPSTTSIRNDHTKPSELPSSSSSSTQPSPYTVPTHNNSAPVIPQVSPFSIHPIRSVSTPGGSGKRIMFAPNLSVHTTWPASVYDRRAEIATCNRLTPTLAQRIKEELNAWKIEMEVHPDSRHLTHFFV